MFDVLRRNKLKMLSWWLNKVCQYPSLNFSLNLTLRTWSKALEDGGAKINVFIMIYMCVRSSWVRLPSLKNVIFMVNFPGWRGWRWSREICPSCQSCQNNIFFQVSSPTAFTSCFVNYCFGGLFQNFVDDLSICQLLVSWFVNFLQLTLFGAGICFC